jgi:hypothetical protein
MRIHTNAMFTLYLVYKSMLNYEILSLYLLFSRISGFFSHINYSSGILVTNSSRCI